MTIEFRKDKLIKLAIALVAFIFGFVSWFKMKIEFMGYSQSESFGLLQGDMFEASTWLGLAKVFAIIQIVLFVVLVVVTFIDLGKKIPALGNVDIAKFAPIAYFGCYALMVVFGLIGCLANISELGITVDVVPAVGWYFGLILTIGGLVMTFIPEKVFNILSGIKISK